MRKRFRVLLLATIVAAVAVPVGFALSLEPAAAPSYAVTSVAPAAIVMPALMPEGAERAAGLFSSMPELADAAKLLLVGTTLFGLAAVLRKAS